MLLKLVRIVGQNPFKSDYSEDTHIVWHGTSGRGNANCGDPCTDFDEHYPFDSMCTVAKGVYHHDYHNTEYNANYHCFQWKDTNKYCWTFDRRNTCPHFPHNCCQPLGYVYTLYGYYSEGWNFASFTPVQRSDLNSCGPPCKEFKDDY